MEPGETANDIDFNPALTFFKVHWQHIVADILGEVFETELLGGKGSQRQADEIKATDSSKQAKQSE